MSEPVPTAAEVRIAGTSGPEGLTLITHGMAAHGLPELQIGSLPPYLGRAWARLLAVLAHRLATTSPASRFTAPGEIIITPSNIAAVLGTDEMGVAVPIRLEASGEPPRLTPLPPREYEGTVDQWRREVALKLLPAARI